MWIRSVRREGSGVWNSEDDVLEGVELCVFSGAAATEIYKEEVVGSVRWV